jgi:hypothetical protein
MMCQVCGETGRRPMPWRNIPGLKRLYIGFPPTKRNPAGWGNCPYCRHGKLVERV